MNTGDYWQSKTNKRSIIKLIQFLGDDTWSCRSVNDGSDDDLFGSYIYHNFTKVEDEKKIKAYEEDFNNFAKFIKKITHKIMKKQREKK